MLLSGVSVHFECPSLALVGRINRSTSSGAFMFTQLGIIAIINIHVLELFHRGTTYRSRFLLFFLLQVSNQTNQASKQHSNCDIKSEIKSNTNIGNERRNKERTAHIYTLSPGSAVLVPIFPFSWHGLPRHSSFHLPSFSRGCGCGRSLTASKYISGVPSLLHQLCNIIRHFFSRFLPTTSSYDSNISLYINSPSSKSTIRAKRPPNSITPSFFPSSKCMLFSFFARPRPRPRHLPLPMLYYVELHRLYFFFLFLRVPTPLVKPDSHPSSSSSLPIDTLSPPLFLPHCCCKHCCTCKGIQFRPSSPFMCTLLCCCTCADLVFFLFFSFPFQSLLSSGI